MDTLAIESPLACHLFIVFTHQININDLIYLYVCVCVYIYIIHKFVCKIAIIYIPFSISQSNIIMSHLIVANSNCVL